MWEILTYWPDGDGEFAVGWLAMKHQDFATAIRHFQAVQTTPNLIDCRQLAVISWIFSLSRQQAKRQVPINAEDIRLMTTPVDRLIELGGIRADKFYSESHVLNVVLEYRLYPQARTLALLWLSRSPTDPVAMYDLAVADYNLNDLAMSAALFNRAIDNHLPDDMAVHARQLLDAIGHSSSTAPTTRVAG